MTTTTPSTQAQPAVAIIGYGTAGVNAIIGLRTTGYDGPIRVFSDTSTIPYSPILTSYYAAGKKTYEQCFPWSAAALADLKVEVFGNCPVQELDPQAHVVRTPQGEFAYSKCVVATGSQPTCVGFPTVEGDEEYRPIVLRSMEDAERLKSALERPDCKRVLVSGASMVALKTLEACLDHGKDCTLVGMNDHVLDFNALPAAAERFERGLIAKGVKLRLGQTIAAVKRLGAADAGAPDAGAAGAGGLQVTFSNGEVDVFDEISVSHGMRSNLGFVKDGSLDIDRALVVDEFMRTSDPDVYAAGDVAQALELVSGEKRIVGIWKNAAVQGECAGKAIAVELAGKTPSADDAFAGAISTNTIAVNGTLFISAGTIELTDDRWVEVRETDDTTVVYIFEDADGASARGEGGATSASRRLVGFNLTCDEDVAGSVAYDTGAMLTMRIEQDCRR